MVMERSATAGPVAVVAVALLFAGLESIDVDEIVAVLLMVPTAPPLTATTRVNVALPGANAALLQVTGPVEPTAGVAQLQPAGEESETNVVAGGSRSLRAALIPLLGPALVATMV